MFWYLLYKLGQFLVHILPTGASYRLAGFISLVQYHISKKDRLTVINNLKGVGVDYPLPVEYYAKEVFRNFAIYLTDFFRSSNISKEGIDEYVKIEGFSYIDDALKKGEGVIVLSAHIGNWELGGMAMSARGYPISAVVLEHKNDKVNSIFINNRTRWGIDVIPLRVAGKKSYSSLNSNRMLAIVGDRDFSNKGIRIDFFGKPSILPKGPAALSLKTGASIVPGFVLIERPGKYTLRFEGPIALENPTHNLDVDIKLLTEKCARIIEKYIRKYPTQWLMFRQFWIDE